MVDEGMPYIVPLSYGYRVVGSSLLELFFHCAVEGRKLDILRKNSTVCFEISREGEIVHMDNPCESGYNFASIIGFGNVVFLSGDEEKSEALAMICSHQSGQSVSFSPEQVGSVCIFKIVSSDYAGKKKAEF